MTSRDTPLKRDSTFVNEAMAEEFYDFCWAISRKRKLNQMRFVEICLTMHLYVKISRERVGKKDENFVVVALSKVAS